MPVEKSLRLAVLGHTIASPDNRMRWKRLAEMYGSSEVTLLPPAKYSSGGAQGQSQMWVAERRSEGNYTELPVEYGKGWFVTLPYYKGIRTQLQQIGPNVVYAIGEVFNPIVAQAALASKFLRPRPKLIFHVNHNIPYELRRLRHKIYEKCVFRNSAGAVAENTTAAEILKHRGFSKPVLIQAAPGASEACFRPGDKVAARASIGLATDAVVVGFVGGFRPEKGGPDLVAAFATLPRDAVLLLVGDGPLRSEIKAQASSLGLMERLVMAGFVPRSETPRLYQAMDVMVLPSRSSAKLAEQFGNVLAEAMLCGTAVVGSTCGAIPEVIGEAGLVFPEGDVDTLAKSLRKLRDEPAFRHSLADRGLRLALEKYSASALSRRFHDFCASLL